MSSPTTVAVTSTLSARGHWQANVGLKLMIGSSSARGPVSAPASGSRARRAPELADGHQAGDHQQQGGERGEQDGLRRPGRRPGAGRGAADRDDAERDAAAEQHVAGAVRGDGADQRGDADDDQRPGGGLRGGLAEGVDQHRDREDGAAAAERAQAEPDEQAGDDGDRQEAEGHAVRVGIRADQVQADLARRCRRSRRPRPAAAGGVEQGRGDRGAVAAGAVHPHLAGGHLVEPRSAARGAGCSRRRRCGRRRARRCGGRRGRSPRGGGGPGRGRRRSRSGTTPARGRCRRPSPAGVPVACGGGPVDADADQLALRLGDALGGLAEQGERGAPRDQPAEVGREAAVEAEVERCRATWPAANAVRLRRSTTHSPASMRRRSSAGSACAGADRSGCGRAGGVGGRHVRVVGRLGAEAGEQLADVGLLVLGEHRVGPASPGRWSRTVASDWVAEQNEPKPWVGNTSAASGSSVGQPVGRGVLVRGPGRRCARRRAGPGGRWRRTAASRRRRRRDLLAGRSASVERVGEVGEGVAGGGQRGDPHPVADLDDLRRRGSGCGRRRPRRPR